MFIRTQGRAWRIVALAALDACSCRGTFESEVAENSKPRALTSDSAQGFSSMQSTNTSSLPERRRNSSKRVAATSSVRAIQGPRWSASEPRRPNAYPSIPAPPSGYQREFGRGFGQRTQEPAPVSPENLPIKPQHVFNFYGRFR